MAQNTYNSFNFHKWLIQKAAEATGNGDLSRKIILSNDQRGRSTAMLGKLYFYKYDPLYGDRMTKYDKFPMCIPLKRYHNGFLGINLHYLDTARRKYFLKLLMEFNKGIDAPSAASLDITYDKLIATSKLENLTKPCVHRYLWSQCRSRFIQIHQNEFQLAAILPVDDFVFNQ